jgi:hypothetical protein
MSHVIYHGSYDSLFNKKKQYSDIENRRVHRVHAAGVQNKKVFLSLLTAGLEMIPV